MTGAGKRESEQDRSRVKRQHQATSRKAQGRLPGAGLGRSAFSRPSSHGSLFCRREFSIKRIIAGRDKAKCEKFMEKKQGQGWEGQGQAEFSSWPL